MARSITVIYAASAALARLEFAQGNFFDHGDKKPNPKNAHTGYRPRVRQKYRCSGDGSEYPD